MKDNSKSSDKTIVDLHQDFFGYIDNDKGKTEKIQTSIPLVEKSLIKLLVASTFDMRGIDRSISPETVEYSEELMERYRKLCESPKWQLVLDASDLDESSSDDATKLVIHVEGIQSFSKNILDDLNLWYAMGCRSIGPMWNLDNGLGGTQTEENKGLTDKGIEVIKWIDERPMILDVSHMSKQTFWDTLDLASGTVIASHANARSLCNHPRNLDDDQILALAERGGVVGLVFSQAFVNGGSKTKDLNRLIEHAWYIADLAGIESLAIGTDLGGIDDPIPEVAGVDRFNVLVDALEKEFGSDTPKILGENSIRALRTSLI